MLLVEGVGALLHLLDGRVRDDLFSAGTDEYLADLTDGADDSVGQHHRHAPHVSALIELRMHGEEAVAEVFAEKEVCSPLSL
jgi:hypothetical protein